MVRCRVVSMIRIGSGDLASVSADLVTVEKAKKEKKKSVVEAAER